MYKKILIAIDGSDVAQKALEHGLKLAKSEGVAVTLVTVTDPVVMSGYASVPGTIIDPVPEMLEAQTEAAREILVAGSAVAGGQGVEAATELVEGTSPADGIIAAAKKIGADLIILGSHGRTGFGRLLLGSQTSHVLAHTEVPVLVVR